MSIRLPAPARREQILDVAVEVFARSGFHGASMNDVADAAGVTKPVLYQHFDSKQDLYMALLHEVGNRLLTAITKATAGVAGGRQQTEQGFLAYFQWVADDNDCVALGGPFNHIYSPKPTFGQNRAVRKPDQFETWWNQASPI